MDDLTITATYPAPINPEMPWVELFANTDTDAPLIIYGLLRRRETNGRFYVDQFAIESNGTVTEYAPVPDFTLEDVFLTVFFGGEVI